MKRKQGVSPGVVIAVLVVVIAIIGVLYYRGLNRPGGTSTVPEGKIPMMGPIGMMKMQQERQQQNTMPQAPTVGN